MVACENEPMATRAATDTSIDPRIPLYRLDTDLYRRFVEAGMLGGAGVELVDGLLVERDGQHPDSIHRLNLDTYNRMVATGLLEDEPVELLDGLLAEMSPQGVGHFDAILRLTRHFAQARAWLMVQLPLELGSRGEPEPDLALVERPSREHLPRTALLAIEVAVSSHAKDRGPKAELYAQSGIPTYWLVDVPAQTIEVRTDPGPEGYARCETYGLGTKVPSPADGVADLDVSRLFDDHDA